MLSEISQNDVYREQLTRLVQSLALGRTDEVPDALAANSPVMCLELYAVGTLEKRRQKLDLQLEFLAEAFDDLAELLKGYVRSVHADAYETGPDDALRFLEWLEESRCLTPEQRDFVACQRARMAIETEARAKRPGHVRFQELWSVAEELAPALGMNPDLQIHLNPVRAWSRLVTPTFLDNADTLPAEVLFFPVRRTVVTTVLEREGRAMIHELAAFSPCTLKSWSCVSEHADCERLIDVCRELAEMGLVAFS